MKKRTFLTCACLVASLTVCVFSVVQANAGSVEDQREDWSNKWPDSALRPGGPGDVFKTRRAAKINAYTTAVYNANMARTNKLSEAIAKFTQQDIDDPAKRDNAAEDFAKAKKEADDNWTKSENAAYETLIREIRNDYRTALNTRADEFRKARVTVRRKFHLKARSKDAPGPFASREYDSVKGAVTYPRIQEGKDAKRNLSWRLEYEVADMNEVLITRQNTGGQIDRKNDIWWIDDEVVGLGFDFSLWGPNKYYWDGRHYRRRNGDLKCTFKVTEKSSVEQARRELWNINDDDLVTCEKLLKEVKNEKEEEFKRAVLPK